MTTPFTPHAGTHRRPCSADRHERGSTVVYLKPVRPTTAEMLLRRQRRRALLDLFCIAAVVWTVAIFAAAYVSGWAQ